MEQLHFVELMPSDHASLLRPVAPRFPAIARCVGEVALWEIGLLQYLVSVQVHQGSFSRRQQELLKTAPLISFDMKHILAELGELARSVPAIVGQNVRRQDELIPVGQVRLYEVVEQRPLQPRPFSCIDPESIASQLCSSLVVDEPERKGKFDMVFSWEIELRQLSPHSDDLIALFAAGNYVVVRHVGQTVKELPDLRLDLCQSRIDLLDPIGYFLHLCKNRTHVYTLALHSGNLVRNPIPLRPELVALADQRSAFCIPREQLREVDFDHSLQQRLSHRLRILPDEIDVYHCAFTSPDHNTHVHTCVRTIPLQPKSRNA